MERSKAIITLIFILNLVAFSAIGAKVSKRKYTIFDQKIEIQRDLHQSPEKKGPNRSSSDKLIFWPSFQLVMSDELRVFAIQRMKAIFHCE